MSDAAEGHEPPEIEWARFLETVPPGAAYRVANVAMFANGRWVARPEIQLHCSSAACDGTRFFSGAGGGLIPSEPKDYHLTYTCRNCETTEKTFSVRLIGAEGGSKDGLAVKFGELPPFGPPVPSRVISLIGPDRELFLRGRRAENQGLGIGAFAYYRRVVENQKGRLIKEVGKVANRLGAPPSVLEKFERAEAETQFSRAVEEVQDALPSTLLIDGHNPLALLHSATSQGLHSFTDEDCLELATSIRVVLTELADRIGQALKDEAELKQAVSRLFRK